MQILCFWLNIEEFNLNPEIRSQIFINSVSKLLGFNIIHSLNCKEQSKFLRLGAFPGNTVAKGARQR